MFKITKKEKELSDLLEKTVEEIKEDCEGKDLQFLKKVLKKEEKGKNRKTLTNWLKDSIEKKMEHTETPQKTVKKSMWDNNYVNLLLGFILGAALVLLLLHPGDSLAYSQGYSAAEANEMVVSYLEETTGQQDEVNISVENVESLEYEDLHVVTLRLEDQEGYDEIKVYVSKQSGLLFMGSLTGMPPIDLETKEMVG